MMKGIILAGGTGSRLHPITQGISKQLTPVYDKPMIYYPLSTLMLAGIRDILIITTPEDQEQFRRLLGDGTRFGVHFDYKVQPSPDGLAQAFILGADFIGDNPVALVLGDNIFYGNHFGRMLREAVRNAEDNHRATVFGKYVNDPERFGIAEFDDNGKVISLEEKPVHPKSNFAVVGLYFYDNDVIDIAKNVKPSDRGELEITSVNAEYLHRKKLKVQTLDNGDVWLDTGTINSLTDAEDFVRVIQTRTGQIVGSPEVTAFQNGWISKEQLEILAEPLKKSGYGKYL